MLSNIYSFVGKGRSDNNVKVSLTFTAPIIRQMATSNIIAPNTATTAFRPTTTVTETHRKVKLGFGNVQKNPNFKLRNNF
jgi:hypothetical protein